MSAVSLLHDLLYIPKHHQRNLSTDRVVCLVHDDWLSGLRQRCIKDVMKAKTLSKADAALFLAPSNQTLPKHWSRVSIKVVKTNCNLVPGLHNGPLYNLKPASSCMEHLVQSARENFRNFWALTHVQYSLEEMETFQKAEDQLSKVLQTYFQRLSPSIYIKIPEGPAESHASPRRQTYHHDNHCHGNNIIPTYAVIEMKSTFFLIQPFVCSSIKDIVSYSPAIFNTSHAKSLFVLYQILQAMLHLHETGLNCGDLHMHNVRIDDKLWVQLTIPHVDDLVKRAEKSESASVVNVETDGDMMKHASSSSNLSSGNTLPLEDRRGEGNERVSECENFVIEGVEIVEEFRTLDFEMEDLAKLTEDWVQHRISNFKYLMILNYLAGRRMDDPNHHPVLPWVMDFSSSSRGYRDLSMSKFRINKGDSQLDFTFEAMGDLNGNSDHIPHHVSDVLSDITYYVYKARRTPKHILCTFVRTKWVPNEYPMSIERMYHWTPDECIPEFFTDPSIFTSIHEDLPDLELPTWCASAAEFIERHMAVLESDYISRKLHQWIDLTFGCKLSGMAAVRAKNVYLHLVDQHKNLMNHGVVQLFNQPHPKRVPRDQTATIMAPRVKKKEMVIAPSKEISFDREAIRPETASIKLPDDFDPIAPLDHFEALYSFTSRSTETLPLLLTKKKNKSIMLSDINNTLRDVWRDMQQFGCLMCELFLANRIQTHKPDDSLHERYNLIGRIYSMDKHSLPRFIHNAVEYLLRLETFQGTKKTVSVDDETEDDDDDDSLLFEYPVINSAGLPSPNPALFLQQYSHILPFPEYFEELYSVLNELKNLDRDIEMELWDVSKSKVEKQKIEKVMSRKKVELIEKFLRRQNGNMSYEGYELLLPYIKELFHDPLTTVQAAWSLIGLVGKDVGPSMLKQHMLPYLSKLFSEEETTPKHMKLYHRSFLVQLLLYLGLETFLTNFCTLLVEAVAGYKNFIVDMETETSQDDIDDDLEENVFLSNKQEIEDDIEPHESEFDQNEENDDIRPDQTDDYPVDKEDQFDGTDDDLPDDDDFPSVSMDTASKSGESMSTDQISSRSIESDSLLDDEAAITDRGSGETASIHSITHIIEMSMDKKQISMETDSLEGDKERSKPSVHFDPNGSSQSLSSKVSTNISYDQSKEFQFTDDQSIDTDEKTSTHMIRSETDEFRQIHYSHTINICDVAAESIKWLSHRLGPLLTAKYLSKNLVRMLALCYLGEEQITVIQDQEEMLPKTTRLVQGDRNSQKILECLTYVSSLYGEQVILLQYLPCIVDLIHVAKRRTTVRAEAGLVAAVVLLRKIIPLLSDKSFLENLQDSILKDAVKPLLRLVISTSTSFPTGTEMRRLILYKMIDVIYILGLRLGFEMTRHYMTDVMQTFFKPFEHIYSNGELTSMTPVSSASDLQHLQSNSKDTGSMDEAYLTIKMDKDTNQYKIGSPITLHMHSQNSMEPSRKSRLVKANYSLSENHTGDDRDDMTDSKGKSGEILKSELIATFSPELALAAYIPLTSVFGSHHMEEYLTSDDLIRKLCSQYDEALYSENKSLDSEDSPCSPEESPKDIGSNVAMVGNRICIQTDEDVSGSPETSSLRKHFQHKGILRIDPDETKCKDVYHNQHRHLKGNWLAYWEHELGLNERDTLFNFKQIKLHTFQGHTNSIRSITCLDNENSFVSASKDKTVKLWSLASFGDGTGRCRHQWSYDFHKKSVFSVAYLENLRKVASSDSTVHIWDPFTGECIRQLDSPRHSPVIALSPLPSPSTVVITATTDSTLRFLDIRKKRYAHEYKCVMGSAGMIRAVSPSPDGSWVVVGFSTGILTLLDLNTGMLLGSWKAHEGEVLQLKAYNKSSFLSTSFDMSVKLWNIDGKEICAFKGHTEPVHCVNFYKNQIVSATTSNKIGVHTSVDSQANFSATKLRSEVFKGVLTSMAILPLNRTLLLGADNGHIRLLC